MITQEFGTIGGLISLHAQTRPDSIALRQDQQVLTYRQLDVLMNRVAAGLQRDGIRARQSVAICAVNSIDYAVVFLGCLRAGVAVVPLAPGSGAQTLVAMLRDAEAQRIFLDAAAAVAFDQANVSLPISTIGLGPGHGGARAALSDWLALPEAAPVAVEIQPDWPCNIIYSSGTTGTPKGIVQSHAMRWTHVQRGALVGYGIEAITLLATPLYSNTTLVSFLPTLALGGCVILMAKFDAAAYLSLAAQYRVTHTMLVPVQYQRIMARPDFGQHDLQAFQMKFCTSAPFAAELKSDILQRWPGGLIEYYGMTEGGGTCVLAAHLFPGKLHTVGMPAEGHDIRLIDENNQAVGTGAIGEVVGHSPAMMNGYFGQPAKTAEAEWFAPDGKRFIRTGDLGRFDDDGFLTLLDRKKDMIISGGFNIYPSDLEAELMQHPAVAEAAVVGVASAQWGETPVGFVVLQTGSTATASELLTWLNQRLGKVQRLADLKLVASLPRSAIGKVLKRALRDAYPA